MTANVNQRVSGIPDCGAVVPHDNLGDNDKNLTHQQTPKHRLLLKSPVRGGIMVDGNNDYKPNNSVSSQSTIFTTLSRTDGGDRLAASSELQISDKQQHHGGKTLTTIAEKIRRGTKKVLHFGNPTTSPNIEVCSGVGPADVTGSTRNGDKQLKKVNSNDSAHTNTISNSSLQELDEDEFTSSELARYMGEVNNEINRLDRNV